MTTLMHPDLNRVKPDTDSFLGMALTLGLQYQKLPESFTDMLMAYLRTQGLGFAQRFRTGIAVGREGLEQGTRQALTCVDIGLEAMAEGDLNTAVTLLAHGDLESLRREGWDRAFGWLQEIQEQSRALRDRLEAHFLQEYRSQIDCWSRIVPETWTAHDPGAEEDVVLDPRSEHEAFTELGGRAAFLRSLPRGPLRRLSDSTASGMQFSSVLRHLILAVALDREELIAHPEAIDRFRHCFADGRMHAHIVQRVLDQITAHARSCLDQTSRARILADVKEEITSLETEPAIEPGLWL